MTPHDVDDYEYRQTTALGEPMETRPVEEDYLDIRPAVRPICRGCNIERACNGTCFCEPRECP